jgi:hypothetical protein
VFATVESPLDRRSVARRVAFEPRAISFSLSVIGSGGGALRREAMHAPVSRSSPPAKRSAWRILQALQLAAHHYSRNSAPSLREASAHLLSRGVRTSRGAPPCRRAATRRARRLDRRISPSQARRCLAWRVRRWLGVGPVRAREHLTRSVARALPPPPAMRTPLAVPSSVRPALGSAARPPSSRQAIFSSSPFLPAVATSSLTCEARGKEPCIPLRRG